MATTEEIVSEIKRLGSLCLAQQAQIDALYLQLFNGVGGDGKPKVEGQVLMCQNGLQIQMFDFANHTFSPKPESK
jgi:hypothetical protein